MEGLGLPEGDIGVGICINKSVENEVKGMKCCVEPWFSSLLDLSSLKQFQTKSLESSRSGKFGYIPTENQRKEK